MIMMMSIMVPYLLKTINFTCYCVFVNTWFDSSEFDIINANHMLKITIAWQPRNNSGRGRHLASLHV